MAAQDDVDQLRSTLAVELAKRPAARAPTYHKAEAKRKLNKLLETIDPTVAAAIEQVMVILGEPL